MKIGVIVRLRLRADGRAERRVARELLRDDERGDLVEIDAAVLFRHVGAEQAERTALGEQLAIERPVLLLEAVLGRQHLVVDELGRGLRRSARCSSVSCSGVITLAGPVSSSSHAPPLVVCSVVVAISRVPAGRVFRPRR